MSIYAKSVASTAAGATAGTYNNIGTVTLRSDARRLLGFIVEASQVATTAAEANQGIIQLSSADLGIGAQQMSCPPYTGGHIATNDQSVATESEFVPFNWPTRGKENITVDFSEGVGTHTAGCSVVASAIYEGGSVPTTNPEALQWLPDVNPLIIKGGQQSSVGCTTVAETALGAINIPAWASELVGVKPFAVNNAVMTAAEEMVGFIRMRSSMPDFDPQEWPYRYSLAASLGTPVGQGVHFQTCRPWGWSFPTTHKNETVTPYNVLNVASSATLAVMCCVYYR
jgi:hypothetical protein